MYLRPVRSTSTTAVASEIADDKGLTILKPKSSTAPSQTPAINKISTAEKVPERRNPKKRASYVTAIKAVKENPNTSSILLKNATLRPNSTLLSRRTTLLPILILVQRLNSKDWLNKLYFLQNQRLNVR